ncbi:hypothetical protein ANN_17289, partial [Periplaneta americana]
IKKNPRISAPKLVSEIELATSKKVHAQTIRRAIHKRGYNGRIARKKPYVCERNRRKRLHFAKKYENRGEDWWEKALFSDESKFNVFGSDGRQMVRRKSKEEMKTKNLRATVKHSGGNVMIWEYLLYKCPKLLHPPPQSPDLNPIEYLWDELDRRVGSIPISSKGELKTRLQEEWVKIPIDIKKLVHSMPRRLKEVIKQKGGSTRY